MRTLVGLLLLVLRAVWRALPHRVRAPRAVPAWRAPAPIDDRSRAMRRAQWIIGGAGGALLLWGVVVLLSSVSLTVPHYFGLALWFGGAIVLHDGVLVPVVGLLRGRLHRIGRDLTAGGIALVQGAFVVGAVLTLTTVPEIYAQSLGTRNPTVLPSEYGPRLVATWLLLALAAAVGNGVLLIRDRRARARARRRTDEAPAA